jgi:integrase
MTIKEFLDGMNPSTRSEYRTTIKYYKDWRSRKQCFPYFADFLLNIKMAQATRIKHLRQVKYFCKECCLKEKNFGSLHPPLALPPLSFSDDDFRKLYAAFEHSDYPKFILEGWQRSRYWKTLIHFAVITALRRKAILSMTWDHINFDELYITVDPEIDKAGQIRYKPITPELVEELRQLRRFYPKGETKVFPWQHGNKIWYRCWKEAESVVGKRFHLHDLKRYSGVLALRAGASPLELQVHIDILSLSGQFVIVTVIVTLLTLWL